MKIPAPQVRGLGGGAASSLPRALGETEDLILALYGAFRRQGLDVVVGGMHPDIHGLAEFDFRVLTVQESGSRALLHGRNRVRSADEVRDVPIYWYAEVEDGMLRTFRPYAQLADARSRLTGRGGPKASQAGPAAVRPDRARAPRSR